MIDVMVAEARAKFWEIIREKEKTRTWGFMVDEQADALVEAVEAVLPEAIEGLLDVVHAISKLDFGQYHCDIDLGSIGDNAYADGEEVLRTMVRFLIEQLVWQSDRLIATLIPKYMGECYADQFNQPPFEAAADSDVEPDPIDAAAEVPAA